MLVETPLATLGYWRTVLPPLEANSAIALSPLRVMVSLSTPYVHTLDEDVPRGAVNSDDAMRVFSQ